MNEKYYRMYPYCFLIKGSNLSAVFNSQFQRIIKLPNDVADLIDEINNTETTVVDEIYKESESYQQIIEYLKKEKIIFVHDQYDAFPDLVLNFETPEHISHLVMEYSNNEAINNKVIGELDSLLVKFIELRFLDEITDETPKMIRNHLEIIENTTVRSVQIMSDVANAEFFNRLLNDNEFNKVVSLVYYNSPFNRTVEDNSGLKSYTTLKYDEIKSYNNGFDSVILELPYFDLAHKYNPYYYKRLCVTHEGEIKNCLKNKTVFGDVLHNNIQEIIKSEKFRDLWYATVDKIEELKDNPLRYNLFITNELKKLPGNLYEIIN